MPRTDWPDGVPEYLDQGPVTDPGPHLALLAGLPRDPAALAELVRGLVFHYREGDLYGYDVPTERVSTDEARTVVAMLDRLLALDGRPLTSARPPEHRLVGCCRDYAVLLTALLRHAGVPARVRYGFALYISETPGNDHVVTEWFDAARSRWCLADAQQDELHLGTNTRVTDPVDLARALFPTAGEVWLGIRSGTVEASRFGYSPELSGTWVVQSQLVLDALALCHREMLIGDRWGLADAGPDTVPTPDDLALLDRLAVATAAGDGPGVRALVADEPGLRLPEKITSWPLADTGQITASVPDLAYPPPR